MSYRGDHAVPDSLVLHAYMGADFGEARFSTTSVSTWMDDGKPWAVFTVEEIIYNTEVSQYVQAKGL